MGKMLIPSNPDRAARREPIEQSKANRLVRGSSLCRDIFGHPGLYFHGGTTLTWKVSYTVAPPWCPGNRRKPPQTCPGRLDEVEHIIEQGRQDPQEVDAR